MKLEGKTILLTGGGGFLGKRIKFFLEAAGAVVYAPRRSVTDIRDPHATYNAVWNNRPHIVIHAAANVGGIGYNSTHGAELIRDNLQMGISIADACKAMRDDAPRLINISSVCAYPAVSQWKNYYDNPMNAGHLLKIKECDLWSGYPQASNAAYGIAKRTIIELLEQYKRAGVLDSQTLILANLYGPGDSFNLERCHVVPAIVRKLVDAQIEGKESVMFWGGPDTKRDLLYVDDAVQAVLAACTSSETFQPMNIATDSPVKIGAIVDSVAAEVKYTGIVGWDQSRPAGDAWRRYDTRYAKKCLGESWGGPAMDIVGGLRLTVEYYREHRNEILAAERKETR